MYWQLISSGEVIPTGKGRKILVPRDQIVDQESLEKLRRLATRLVPPHRYSVLEQSDVSWALAKRYSVKVLLNGTLSKAEIGDIIRRVIGEHIGSKYYRSSMVEQNFQEADAHVLCPSFDYRWHSFRPRRNRNKARAATTGRPLRIASSAGLLETKRLPPPELPAAKRAAARSKSRPASS